MDWSGIFGVELNPWELVARGTAIYFALFLIFRVIIRRDIGAIGMADVLLVVLVADAAQNGMSGQYRTITEGLILILTLVFWNVLLDFVAFRFPKLARWLEPAPLQLISRGRIQHRNLRREFMSVDDLMAKLREHGIDDVRLVRKAMMESDGTVTVITSRVRDAGASHVHEK